MPHAVLTWKSVGLLGRLALAAFLCAFFFLQLKAQGEAGRRGGGGGRRSCEEELEGGVVRMRSWEKLEGVGRS